MTARLRCATCGVPPQWYVSGKVFAGFACTDHLPERIWYSLAYPGAEVQVAHLAKSPIPAALVEEAA